MRTDQLDHTICYARCVRSVQALCQNQPFNLVEHVTAEVYDAVLQAVEDQRGHIAWIQIKTCKMAPPVPGVHGGVCFEYGADPSSLEQGERL